MAQRAEAALFVISSPELFAGVANPRHAEPTESLVSAWRILSPPAKATIGKRSGHVDRCSSQKRIGIVLANSWDSKDLLLTT